MKVFFEAHIPVKTGSDAGIIIARLSSMGFDGFMEEVDHILAYREKAGESASDIAAMLRASGLKATEVAEIAEKNWNALWEADYEPVTVSGRIMVRAPFHKPSAKVEYDIVIEPKMSFGTAHHETTSLMLEMMLELNFNDLSVLDMGSGTAVLAILASKKGAKEVLAIDNDEWAYANARENVAMNATAEIGVELGDASSIGYRRFHVILANINRNILLADIPAYARAMEKGGALLLSGFYEEDLPLISEKCVSSGLVTELTRTKNRWTAALFAKD